MRSFTTCVIFAPCASRERIEDILHPDAHPADARAAAALVWVERDAIHGRKLNPHTGGSKGNTGCSRNPDAIGRDPRRHPGDDRAAPLLRQCLCRPRQTQQVHVPARAHGLNGRANLDLATLDDLDDKTVIFGVISMDDAAPETPQTVPARIRAALEHLPPERLIPAPDCGMKFRRPGRTALEVLNVLSGGRTDGN